jgi:hypothetical protein
MIALRPANVVRLAAAELRREVADGRTTLADALADERSAPMEILALLMTQHRVGEQRASRVLDELGISANRRCGALTDRQRGLIARAFPARRAAA